jgi:hypothetical protein
MFTLESKYCGMTATFLMAILLAVLGCLWLKVNSAYGPETRGMQQRAAFIQSVHLAAPVLAAAGRNIAFESGNAASNAPASYLTMLDCCESDEAIGERIAVTRITSRLLKRTRPEMAVSASLELDENTSFLDGH